jgi:ferredoxin
VNFSRAKLVYFSPTKTTKRILESVAQGLEVGAIDDIDMTPPHSKTPDFSRVKDELVIFGSPVYGGRVPAEAARRFRRIKGCGVPAVIIVVYGNREFEDSMRELADIALELNFRPIACGAFLGEHSFSNEATPIASGRPDTRDLAKAKEFGASIRDKGNNARAPEEMPALQIPGNFPYKQWNQPDASPVIDETKCVACKRCVSVCPMGVASPERPIAGQNKCICCSACIKICAAKARSWEGTPVAGSANWLFENCKKRKDPEVFL